MSRLTKWLLGSAIVLMLVGCFKTKIEIRVNPDGTGTITQVFVIKKEVIRENAASFEEGQMRKQAEESVKEMGEGVRLQSFNKQVKGNMVYVIGVWAFDDINKINMKGFIKLTPPGKKPDDVTDKAKYERNLLSFSFKKLTEDSAELIIKPSLTKPPEKEKPKEAVEEVEVIEEIQELPEEQKALAEQMRTKSKEMMEQMFKKTIKDVNISFTVVCGREIIKTDATWVKDNKITLLEIDFGKLIYSEKFKVVHTKPSEASQNPAETLWALKEIFQGEVGFKMESKKGIKVEFKYPAPAATMDTQTSETPASDVKAETSWFSITFKEKDKERKVGYIKEVRSKTTYQQQPAWRISRDTVFTSLIPNQPKKISALCYVNRDNLSLIKTSATIYMADGTEVRINTQRKENELIITYTPPGRSVKATISPQEEIYPMEIIGDLIAARGLVENKSYRIKIPYPDRPSHPITELVITVKEKVKETIMGKSVEGYYCDGSYSEPDVKKEPIGLLINTQGLILKRIVGIREFTRVSEKEALHKPRDRFEKNNRTDPFMPKYGGDRRPPPPPPPPPPPEWTLLEAREALENMKRIHEKLPPGEEREKALTKEYLKIIDVYKEIYKTDFSRLKEQIAEIRDEADKIFLPAQLIYSQIKYLHAESLRIFDKIKTETQGNLRQKLFNKLTNKLNQITFILDKNQIVIQETEYESKVKALVAEVEEFNRRAKIIIEFYGRNLKINGIIYILERKVISYPSLKITFLGIEIEVPVAYCRYRPNSSALINDRFYNEGEKIDEEIISIDKIEANKIYFSYKGEKIELIYSK